jgi:predicted 2-oxoglutarate/Fe(II)-dependent dioxygenase YbiX
MIQIFQNTITEEEIDEFMQFYQQHQEEEVVKIDHIFSFKSISILERIQDFKFLRRLRYTNFHKLRIQSIDPEVPVILEPHRHGIPFSFIVFLNDDFEGGEFLIDNLICKPKKGQVIFFSGDEPHFVNPVTKGARFTLVAFTHDRNLDFKSLHLL